MPRRGRHQSRSRRRSYDRGGSRGGHYRRSGGRRGGVRMRRQRRQQRMLAILLFVLTIAVGYGMYLDSLQGPQWLSALIKQRHAPLVAQPSAKESFLAKFKHSAVTTKVTPNMQQDAKASIKPKPPAKPSFDFYSMLTKSKAKKVTPASAAPANQWVGLPVHRLQVAELRDKQKAELMQDKLALAGFPVSIVQVKSLLGDRYQVMVGPFQNLLAAHEAQNELQRFGIKGVLR